MEISNPYQDYKEKDEDVHFLDNYSYFQRLMLLKILRPERVLPAMNIIISKELDVYLTKPPSFNLKASFEESAPNQPLIFLLSPGMDPNKDILQLATEQKKKPKIYKSFILI